MGEEKRDIITSLRNELAEQQMRADMNEARANRADQAGREAGEKIEQVLRELGDEKAKVAAKDAEIRVLREVTYRLLPHTADQGGVSFGQEIP